MKKVNKKKALLSSILSLILCVSMFLGSTMAWFTSNVSNTGNRIQAGTLKVDLLMDKQDGNGYVSIADGEGDIFSESTGNGVSWEPGKTEIVFLQVKNMGSLALKYNIVLTVKDTDTEDKINLASVLDYAIVNGATAESFAQANITGWETLVAMDGVEVGDVPRGTITAAQNGQLAEEGSNDCFALAVHMDEDAGNDYQGKTLDIDVQVVAGQLAKEEDSFGNQYDKDATYNDEGSQKAGMAELVSTVHRNVPTQFTLSSDLNDIMHFEGLSAEEQLALYNQVKAQGTVVTTADEFLDGIIPLASRETDTSAYGTDEVVALEGPEGAFDRVLRINCTTVPAKTSDYVVKTTAKPKHPNLNEDPAINSIMLCAFWARSTNDGGDGANEVYIQIEQPSSPYKKDVFLNYTIDDEWSIIFVPYKVVRSNPKATSIGIRACSNLGTVEIGGFEIINFTHKTTLTVDDLPSTSSASTYTELAKDAEWRTAANERIEEIRKGDFTVVVKDANGNMIPNAEVEFDMFEHEFQFGTSVNSSITDATTQEKYGALFNTGVAEHIMKWAPFEAHPDEAVAQVEAAETAGAKYFRGHPLIWQRAFASDGTTYLMPERLFEADGTGLKDKDQLLAYCKAHFESIIGTFPDMVDWDVVNEIVTNDVFEKVHGPELFVEWFKMAREVAGEDAMLYCNEASDVWTDEYIEYLDLFEEMGVDYDGLGIQSHYDNIAAFKMPTELMAFYDKLEADYGKRLKITEFSCSIPDQALQANYMRDVMISCFAEESMDGFLMWGFWDGSNFATYSPIYDGNWNLKPAGQVFADLVYNKWWTRDAKATTNASGIATVRGFYGDYDVTVTVDGDSKTVSCAYHKGYENVLEITID